MTEGAAGEVSSIGTRTATSRSASTRERTAQTIYGHLTERERVIVIKALFALLSVRYSYLYFYHIVFLFLFLFLCLCFGNIHTMHFIPIKHFAFEF